MLNNIIDIENFKPNYNIIDTECLVDYFSFQYRTTEMEKAKCISCRNDEDIYKLYNVLVGATLPMYFYSIDYDSVMINGLFKFVENETIDIIPKLRELSDEIIVNKLNYQKVNREFWCNGYFGKNNEFDEAMEHTISIFPRHKEFLLKYPFLLGKSKYFKNLVFNSIPKILYYFNIDKDKTLKPSISLKNIQLVKEGYCIKSDFSVADEKFIEYSLNDVDFLYRVFEENTDIIKRFNAYKAVKLIRPEFTLTNRVLYTENNTELICEILKINNKQDVTIDYTKYCQTPYPQFNDFVNYVNNNKDVKSDYELKKNYNDKDMPDVNMLTEFGTIDDKFKNVDELDINGTMVKYGLGGLHGAIKNYIGENLVHLDYVSQYPSIILQYKEYFRNVIDVDLYEAIYNLRLMIKHEPEKADLQNGLKLILNTAYGLINSNFNIPISNKILGRFICLKGQSLLLNLMSKFSTDSKMVNVNTDGIIVDVKNCDTVEIVKNDKNKYFVLGVTKIGKLIQYDVNNYIKDKKYKGRFNVKIKQMINKDEKLSVNLQNALSDEVKILPIYFFGKYFTDSDKAYYLTTKEKGTKKVKNLTKPVVLPYYFTDNIDLADLETYEHWAKITYEKIINFTLLEDMKLDKHYDIVIEPDLPENYKLKSSVKRKLNKFFVTGVTGLMGNPKINVIDNGKIIKQLCNYKMTEILKSTVSNGLSAHNSITNPIIIIDIDIYDKHSKTAKKGWQKIKPLLELLKNSNTFESWNNITKGYNKKFIFKGSLDFKIKSNYFEIINKGTVWSNNTSVIYENNLIEPIEIPEIIKKELTKYQLT